MRHLSFARVAPISDALFVDFVVVNNIVNIGQHAASAQPVLRKAREAQRKPSFLDISLRSQRLGGEASWCQFVQH